jgi:hypothetical protein
MYEFNLEYAKSIPSIASHLDSIIGSGTATTDEQKNKLVEALNKHPEISLGSGPWYLATKCPDALAMFGEAGKLDDAFRKYMGCVGVAAGDAGRVQKWEAAKKAFGL